MAYFEEPMSTVEKVIGRRMPITIAILGALCIAIYYKDVQMTSAILVLLTAIVTTLFRDIGQEKANNSITRQEAVEANKSG
jgi:hypothetical protein